MFLFGGPAKSTSTKLAEDIGQRQKAHRTIGGLFNDASAAPVTKAIAPAAETRGTPSIISLGPVAEARKAAQARDAALVGYEMVEKRHVQTIKSVLPEMSNNGFRVLDLMLRRHNEYGGKPFNLGAEDVGRILKVTHGQARDALDELRGLGLVVDVNDKVLPSALALGR